MKLDLFLVAEININPHISQREIKHENECLLDEPQSPMITLTIAVLCEQAASRQPHARVGDSVPRTT